jgi:hypothetical protein
MFVNLLNEVVVAQLCQDHILLLWDCFGGLRGDSNILYPGREREPP